MSTQIHKLNGLIATGTVIICRELNMSIFFFFFIYKPVRCIQIVSILCQLSMFQVDVVNLGEQTLVVGFQ